MSSSWSLDRYLFEPRAVKSLLFFFLRLIIRAVDNWTSYSRSACWCVVMKVLEGYLKRWRYFVHGAAQMMSTCLGTLYPSEWIYRNIRSCLHLCLQYSLIETYKTEYFTALLAKRHLTGMRELISENHRWQLKSRRLGCILRTADMWRYQGLLSNPCTPVERLWLRTRSASSLTLLAKCTPSRGSGRRDGGSSLFLGLVLITLRATTRMPSPPSTSPKLPACSYFVPVLYLLRLSSHALFFSFLFFANPDLLTTHHDLVAFLSFFLLLPLALQGTECAIACVVVSIDSRQVVTLNPASSIRGWELQAALCVSAFPLRLLCQANVLFKKTGVSLAARQSWAEM